MAHRQIGIVPAAENAQTLEILLVLLDVSQRELAAQLSKLRRRHLPFSAQLLFHLRFDRQAVAVPSGHVWCVMPRHALGFDDQILEDFVQPSAEMNFTRGIRRPVMQNKEWLALPHLQNALVDVSSMPGFELFWLVLWQAGLHRKIRFWQIQGLLQFEWFGHD